MKRSTVDVKKHKAAASRRGEKPSDEYRDGERRVRQYHTFGAGKHQRQDCDNQHAGARRAVAVQLSQFVYDPHDPRDKFKLQRALQKD